MRYIITAVIAAIISGYIVGQLFRSAFEKQFDRRIEAVVASSTLDIIRKNQQQGGTSNTGTGFHGPTTAPSIIGPKIPPPSY
jgi:hypothetical protein